MSSTIFAIYCHILLYSKSCSALRIAEVDDYRAACSTDAAIKKSYDCVQICLKTKGLAADQQKIDDLAQCAATIKDTIIGVTLLGSGANKCQQLKDVTEKTCTTSDTKVTVYTKKKESAKGDPHVVNMAGEKFDILATGAFSLLSLTRATEEDLLINGTIARFGAKCGESFITDLENTGGWIRKAYNTGALKVRAVQDTPKQQALQINFGQNWEPLSNLQETAHISKRADTVQLDLSSVTVQVSAGKHWRHGWNFLNLDVQGLASLDDSIRVGGLLGYDDHTQVLQADADCAMFTEAAGTDMQGQQSCLSYLKAN